ncbi:MAG: type II secretion system F family protein [Candidatus Hydrogenedentes bacterium]|nr:type II secretion system F family protein [Candidatus Hydrogenedentota bacterium]
MGLLSPKLSTKSMVPICRQLATSYEAGIPILRGLELVGDNLKDKRASEVILHIKEDVRNGATLGGAARQQQRYLPPFFIALLEAGEKGGRLDVMLRDLAAYFEDRQVMMRKALGAMIYPGLQLGAAWFLGTFALGLVGQIDPMSTKPFSLEAYFMSYLLFQGKAMLVVAGLCVVAAALSYAGAFRWIWGWVANFVPPFRMVTRKFSLARFFRSMSLLVGSGMNMKSCIQNSAAITVNPYIEQDLLRAVPFVAEGATLVQAFGACKYLTPVSREMIAVGEHTGNLETSLHKVSEYHLQEAEHAVYVMTRVATVLIILGIGAVVGYVIISFYAKLYGSMLNAI